MRRLLPLVLISGSLAAQLAGVAGVDVADYRGLGYARPTVTALAGAEYIAPRWEASLIGDASAARKYDKPSGHSIGATLTALAKPWGPLLVGACLAYEYTASPDWHKWAYRPCAILGASAPPWRVTITRSWPGTDVQNDSRDWLGSVRYSVTPSTRVTLHAGYYRFHATYNPAINYTRGSWGVSVTQVF